MNIKDILHPFDQHLARKKLLPWWEVLRSYLLNLMFGLTTYTIFKDDYNEVACPNRSEHSTGYDFTAPENPKYLANLCRAQLPWYCKHLGFWMSGILILHTVAEKWWLALPRVNNAISSLGVINGSTDVRRIYLEEPKLGKTMTVYFIRCVVLICLIMVLVCVLVWILIMERDGASSGYKVTFKHTGNNTKQIYTCTYEAYNKLIQNVILFLGFLAISMNITVIYEMLPYSDYRSFLLFFYANSEKMEELEERNKQTLKNFPTLLQNGYATERERKRKDAHKDN
ncbi:uncharacterized protein LOC144744607 [Ciona intestinalis]